MAETNWSIAGKTVVITGANSGVGKATALALAEKGCGRLILACRSKDSGDATVREIEEKYCQGDNNLSVICKQLDLSSLESVRKFADDMKQNEQRLDVLVCNAGIWPGNDRQVTIDGNEITFATNHLGHFYLCRLLIDLMKKSSPSRIVIVASKGYCFTWPSGYNIDDVQLEKPGAYSGTKAYCQSKLANMLFARQLNKFLNSDGHCGISVFVLYPGAFQTGLVRNLPSGVQSFTKPFLESDLSKSAKTPVFCCCQPGIEKETGSYYV